MDDEFVQDRYEQEVRGERNARISDTDKYVQLPDITVQSAARSKRAQLTESDRQALLDYRQALKDLPDQGRVLQTAAYLMDVQALPLQNIGGDLLPALDDPLVRGGRR